VIPTYSQSSNRSQTGESAGESVQDYDTNLIHANVFLQLPFGKSVIFRRGQLATVTNHAHLVSWSEKQSLERASYPEPVTRGKQRQQTAADVLLAAKDQLADHGSSSNEIQEQSANPGPKITL
jgi:hypothetical protein